MIKIKELIIFYFRKSENLEIKFFLWQVCFLCHVTVGIVLFIFVFPLISSIHTVEFEDSLNCASLVNKSLCMPNQLISNFHVDFH